MFKPKDHDFYSRPVIGIVYRNNICNIVVHDKELALEEKSGVYAWTITSEAGVKIPVYIGLYGKTAKKPSLHKRFRQHLNGLNMALQENPPTNHWRDCLVPKAKDYLKDGDKEIEIYFGHFNREEVAKLEEQLIEKYQPEWNSRGVVR